VTLSTNSDEIIVSFVPILSMMSISPDAGHPPYSEFSGNIQMAENINLQIRVKLLFEHSISTSAEATLKLDLKWPVLNVATLYNDRSIF
jgi:hypothetical protein